MTPRLKKCGLDGADVKDRPVSNLTFMSKITDRLVSTCPREEQPSTKVPSRHRRQHSTETAVLKIVDYLQHFFGKEKRFPIYRFENRR